MYRTNHASSDHGNTQSLRQHKDIHHATDIMINTITHLHLGLAALYHKVTTYLKPNSTDIGMNQSDLLMSK